MVDNPNLIPFAQFGIGVLILALFLMIKPTYKAVGSFSYNCKQSVIKSSTFFEASKGCLYLKGE